MRFDGVVVLSVPEKIGVAFGVFGLAVGTAMVAWAIWLGFYADGTIK